MPKVKREGIDGVIFRDQAQGTVSTGIPQKEDGKVQVTASLAGEAALPDLFNSFGWEVQVGDPLMDILDSNGSVIASISAPSDGWYSPDSTLSQGLALSLGQSLGFVRTSWNQYEDSMDLAVNGINDGEFVSKAVVNRPVEAIFQRQVDILSFLDRSAQFSEACGKMRYTLTKGTSVVALTEFSVPNDLASTWNKHFSFLEEPNGITPALFYKHVPGSPSLFEKIVNPGEMHINAVVLGDSFTNGQKGSTTFEVDVKEIEDFFDSYPGGDYFWSLYSTGEIKMKDGVLYIGFHPDINAPDSEGGRFDGSDVRQVTSKNLFFSADVQSQNKYESWNAFNIPLLIWKDGRCFFGDGTPLADLGRIFADRGNLNALHESFMAQSGSLQQTALLASSTGTISWLRDSNNDLVLDQGMPAFFKKGDVIGNVGGGSYIPLTSDSYVMPAVSDGHNVSLGDLIAEVFPISECLFRSGVQGILVENPSNSLFDLRNKMKEMLLFVLGFTNQGRFNSLSVQGDIVASGSVSVQGDCSIGGDLEVDGEALFKNNVVAESGLEVQSGCLMETLELTEGKVNMTKSTTSTNSTVDIKSQDVNGDLERLNVECSELRISNGAPLSHHEKYASTGIVKLVLLKRYRTWDGAAFTGGSSSATETTGNALDPVHVEMIDVNAYGPDFTNSVYKKEWLVPGVLDPSNLLSGQIQVDISSHFQNIQSKFGFICSSWDLNICLQYPPIVNGAYDTSKLCVEKIKGGSIAYLRRMSESLGTIGNSGIVTKGATYRDLTGAPVGFENDIDEHEDPLNTFLYVNPGAASFLYPGTGLPSGFTTEELFLEQLYSVEVILNGHFQWGKLATHSDTNYYFGETTSQRSGSRVNRFD